MDIYQLLHSILYKFAAWVFLAAAIFLEVTGTTFMKLSEGFSKPIFGALMFVFYAASFTSLTFALKGLELGIAYAIWAGLGTAIIAIIGLFFFQEQLTILKVISLLLIIAGVVGLNLAGNH